MESKTSSSPKPILSPLRGPTTLAATLAGIRERWRRRLTTITDTPDGLRTLRCPNATFYIHKTEAITGVVMLDEDQWWWYAGTDEDQGVTSLREEAEQSLLECLSVNGSGKP